ncbi:MAG: PQQ-binding-like beta-propeller repeat protein [Planctomycetota bacterium]|nr:PQQ-binding-like beta-propeller repeat protein [Planctomycetota bacterium]
MPMIRMRNRCAPILLALAAAAGLSRAAEQGAADYQPTPERPTGFRGDGTGRYPGATPPLTWERKASGNAYATKNILWMTRMPSGSVASPIVVGDRIFVCANFADLLCIDKRTGRIAWSRSNGYYEAATEADLSNSDFKSSVTPVADDLRKLNDRILEQCNANISSTGPSPAQEDAMTVLSNQKRDMEVKLFKALSAYDKKRFCGTPYMQHCGTTSGTPVSDGTRVWACFLGGVNGPCSMTVACYDLDGNRKWLQFIEGINAPEHGNHSSMLLAGSRLIFMGNDLTIGYDKDTGRELWRVKGPGYNDGIAVPRSFKVDGEDAMFRAHSKANILRLSDGKVLSDYKAIGWLWSTPMIENGIAYYGDRNKRVILVAVKMPARAGEAPTELYRLAMPDDTKNTERESGMVVASPLLHEGLVYSICEGGTMAAVDAQTGKEAYWATPFSTDVKWVKKPGSCASPTLGGKNIYLMGDMGACIVLQPGRAYNALATNVLEERPLNGFSFISTPVFEGTRMYYRSGAYLYCIGER